MLEATALPVVSQPLPSCIQEGYKNWSDDVMSNSISFNAISFATFTKISFKIYMAGLSKNTQIYISQWIYVWVSFVM